MDNGLKVKYNVYKTKDGALVNNCFVLRPDKDPAAVVALQAYAGATGNRELAHDLLAWVGTPTVDAEDIRHGTWTKKHNDDSQDYYEDHWDYYCSCCTGFVMDWSPPYCPNCGAKMEGSHGRQ